MGDIDTSKLPQGDRFDEAAKVLLGNAEQPQPDANAVLEMQADLRQAIGEPPPDWVDQSSPAGACLAPLLAALDWNW